MGLFEQKLKYKLVFLRKEYSTMNVVKIVKLIEPKILYRIREKTFNISYEFPCYSHLLEKIYFIDYESGSQLMFSAIDRQLNPEQLDLIVSNKIVKEIASGVLDDMKGKIAMVVLGALLGGMLAAIVIMGIYQKKIDDLYAQQENYVPFGVLSSMKIILKSLVLRK